MDIVQRRLTARSRSGRRWQGGEGTWPALWFLGTTVSTTNITSPDNVAPCNWPAVGSDEIDLVEIMKGSVTYYNPSVHSAGNSPECLIGPISDVSQNWHVYTTTWSAGTLAVYRGRRSAELHHQQ